MSDVGQSRAQHNSYTRAQKQRETQHCRTHPTPTHGFRCRLQPAERPSEPFENTRTVMTIAWCTHMETQHMREWIQMEEM